MDFEKSEETGYIIQKQGNEIIRRFSAVRAALSWPCLELNLLGFFLVLGEEAIGVPYFQEGERRRGKLHLLHEWEALDIRTPLDILVTELIGAAARYKFEKVYGVMEKFQGEDFSEHTKFFQDYVYNKRASLRLEQPPLAANLGLSVDTINTWKRKGLLEVPESSIVKTQMDMAQTTDLNQLPKEFNAVNALRLGVCDFNAFPPPNSRDSNWRDRVPRGGTGRWSTQGNQRGYGK